MGYVEHRRGFYDKTPGDALQRRQHGHHVGLALVEGVDASAVGGSPGGVNENAVKTYPVARPGLDHVAAVGAHHFKIAERRRIGAQRAGHVGIALHGHHIPGLRGHCHGVDSESGGEVGDPCGVSDKCRVEAGESV